METVGFTRKGMLSLRYLRDLRLLNVNVINPKDKNYTFEGSKR
jgi:hypothetical protein